MSGNPQKVWQCRVVMTIGEDYLYLGNEDGAKFTYDQLLEALSVAAADGLVFVEVSDTPAEVTALIRVADIGRVVLAPLAEQPDDAP